MTKYINLRRLTSSVSVVFFYAETSSTNPENRCEISLEYTLFPQDTFHDCDFELQDPMSCLIVIMNENNYINIWEANTQF